MKYMLDSNVVIAVALGLDGPIRGRMADHDEGDFVISAISYAEIAHGSYNGKPPRLELLGPFLAEVLVLSFDSEAARIYATIPFRRASYDRLIAAHALALGLTVITGNVKHFADVPGLKVENWLT
jgi:tRNA(fMet)-specific endonuclease VapC